MVSDKITNKGKYSKSFWTKNFGKLCIEDFLSKMRDSNLASQRGELNLKIQNTVGTFKDSSFCPRFEVRTRGMARLISELVVS